MTPWRSVCGVHLSRYQTLYSRLRGRRESLFRDGCCRWRYGSVARAMRPPIWTTVVGNPVTKKYGDRHAAASRLRRVVESGTGYICVILSQSKMLLHFEWKIIPRTSDNNKNNIISHLQNEMRTRPLGRLGVLVSHPLASSDQIHQS